jgi:hypothetical protein
VAGDGLRCILRTEGINGAPRSTGDPVLSTHQGARAWLPVSSRWDATTSSANLVTQMTATHKGDSPASLLSEDSTIVVEQGCQMGTATA